MAVGSAVAVGSATEADSAMEAVGVADNPGAGFNPDYEIGDRCAAPSALFSILFTYPDLTVGPTHCRHFGHLMLDSRRPTELTHSCRRNVAFLTPVLCQNRIRIIFRTHGGKTRGACFSAVLI